MIPKAELHCHLEGSVSPDLARALGQRNGVAFPDGMFDGHGHFVWRDFLSFLDAYDRVCLAVVTPASISLPKPPKKGLKAGLAEAVKAKE